MQPSSLPISHHQVPQVEHVLQTRPHQSGGCGSFRVYLPGINRRPEDAHLACAAVCIHAVEAVPFTQPCCGTCCGSTLRAHTAVKISTTGVGIVCMQGFAAWRGSGLGQNGEFRRVGTRCGAARKAAVKGGGTKAPRGLPTHNPPTPCSSIPCGKAVSMHMQRVQITSVQVLLPCSPACSPRT